MQLFSVLLGLGALTGLLLIVWKAPKKETSHYLDAALVILFCALLVSRAGYVAVHFPYYQIHPGDIIQVWKGGLSGIGALAGGALGVLILAGWWRGSTGAMADIFLPLVGTLTITAWLGCWLDSCGYGLPTTAWWALPARDEWGVLAYRVPVQLIGAIVTLVIIWFLDRVSKWITIPGISASLGVFLIAAELFALSFLRADSTPILYGLRLEAWGAIGLMLVCLLTGVVLLYRWKRRRSLYPPDEE
jgi:prolipoprotein diacylglyceryltransferase